MVTHIAPHPLLPHLVTPLPGPKAKEIIERDHAVLSPSYTRCYPFVMKRGEGAIAEDVDSNRFLDFAAGIAVVATGHSHPRVVAAIQRQAAEFLHMSGTDFYYETMVRLAERLAHLTPGALPRRVYFGNSGAEAIEAALKLARMHTGRDKFIAFFGGFHGRTMGALSLTGSKVVQRRGFGPMLPVYHVPYPDCYRFPHEDSAVCGASSIEYLEERLFKTILPPEEVAAIVVEPVQGEGGYLVPHRSFHQQLRRVADKYGILLIHDEVQSGMGRTGRMFASEHFGVVPDIVTLAKGIASGMPLSAMIARADIMDWPPGAHASTFGGNPVSIAAALATLDLLEEELIENARLVGNHLMARLRTWPERFRHVGAVRGLGLMIGIELVRDQAAKERAPQLRDRLEMLSFERGLLTLGCGPNSLRLCPPLVLTREQADCAADTLEECLRALEH
ncbi:MAG: acetyl ornithine aminotransferase family protein [Acidobacteriaceae bacterium]|nr:acetyl ornithine aminotransferase family protein [Acidobacteriaceae bacterium]